MSEVVSVKCDECGKLAACTKSIGSADPPPGWSSVMHRSYKKSEFKFGESSIDEVHNWHFCSSYCEAGHTQKRLKIGGDNIVPLTNGGSPYR